MKKYFQVITLLIAISLPAIIGSNASATVPVYQSGMLAVHRFYNTKTLTHFYSPDEEEVARVKATLPDFNYEGIKFNAYSYPDMGRVGVYRFYNIKTLSHFYTSDHNEVNIIRGSLPDFVYEGISYYANEDATTTGSRTGVYRFYNTRTLTHLYTADVNEADRIRNTLSDYNYEGLKYGAPASQYYENCTAAHTAGVTPLYRGQVGYGTHLDRDSDGIACET